MFLHKIMDFPTVFGVRLRELGRVFPGFPSVGRAEFTILVLVFGVPDNAKAPSLSAGLVRGHVRHGATTHGELDSGMQSAFHDRH
jgi:hypothetical protein